MLEEKTQFNWAIVVAFRVGKGPPAVKSPDPCDITKAAVERVAGEGHNEQRRERVVISSPPKVVRIEWTRIGIEQTEQREQIRQKCRI